MAHNFQGYDSYFILLYLREQGLKYDVIMRGAKVLSLKVELFTPGTRSSKNAEMLSAITTLLVGGVLQNSKWRPNVSERVFAQSKLLSSYFVIILTWKQHKVMKVIAKRKLI